MPRRTHRAAATHGPYDDAMTRASAVPRVADTRVSIESEAVLAGAIAAVLFGGTAAIVFFGANPPLWGGISVGAAAAASVLVSGAVTAGAAYWRSRNLPGQEWRHELSPWKFSLDVAVVSVVHGVIAAILVVVTFLLLQRSFEGLVVDGFAATGAVALSCGLAGYWIFLSASAITTTRLSTLLVVFMAVSTLASMATAQDPAWWEYHFSQLGTFGDFSSTLFNLALIVAGAFVTTFAIYVDRDLRILVHRGVLARAWAPQVISIAFIVMGVMLAGVGVFPLTFSVLLHNLCAAGMSVAFALLLLGSPFVLRGMPRRFFVFCVGGFALLVGSFLLFEPIGYYNLTAFELAAFAIIFGWIAVFIRFVEALAADVAPAAPAPSSGATSRDAVEHPA